MADHSCLPRGIRFPLPSTPSPVKGKFCFRKPVSVKVVGSYLLGTITKPQLNVDIAMEMPKVRVLIYDCLTYLYVVLSLAPLCTTAACMYNSCILYRVKHAIWTWLATCINYVFMYKWLAIGTFCRFIPEFLQSHCDHFVGRNKWCCNWTCRSLTIKWTLCHRCSAVREMERERWPY